MVSECAVPSAGSIAVGLRGGCMSLRREQRTGNQEGREGESNSQIVPPAGKQFTVSLWGHFTFIFLFNVSCGKRDLILSVKMN
jgi:hypothetical protein